MQRIRLIDTLGHDFIMSGAGDAESLGINCAIVRWMYNRQCMDVFVGKDPHQTDPQGYILYEKNVVDGNNYFMPFSCAIYDWELEKFFKVFD